MVRESGPIDSRKWIRAGTLNSDSGDNGGKAAVVNPALQREKGCLFKYYEWEIWRLGI